MFNQVDNQGASTYTLTLSLGATKAGSSFLGPGDVLMIGYIENVGIFMEVASFEGIGSTQTVFEDGDVNNAELTSELTAFSFEVPSSLRSRFRSGSRGLRVMQKRSPWTTSQSPEG